MMVFFLFFLLAGLAHGHSAPIAPSVCTFDRFTIAVPANGFEASAAPAGPADAYRIVYDPGARRVQFCPADPADPLNRCATVTPERSFGGGGLTGTLALSLFQATLLQSGDILVPNMPLSMTVDGVTATLSASMTTGLVTMEPLVVEGSPLAADGRFTLVGTAIAGGLPAPLGETASLVTMSCQAAPPPDLDQFSEATRTRNFAGAVDAETVRLRAAFRPPAGAADFTLPAIVRVTTNGTVLASASLPGGLASQGRRKFVGQTADGGKLTVRSRGRSGYRLSLVLQTATSPTVTSGRVDVMLTYQVGGLLSRTTRPFRATRRGLRSS